VRALRWSWSLAVFFALTSCSSDRSASPSNVPAPVSAITLSGAPSDGILVRGTTTALSAAVLRGPERTPDTASVQWSSSASAVAEVSPTGIVTARSAGDATITATRDGIQASLTIAVHEGVTLPSPSGGAVTTLAFDGALRIELAAGSVPSGISRLTVRRSAAPPVDDRVVAGTVFDFFPAELALSAAATLELVHSGVPAAEHGDVRVAQWLDGRWVELDGSADASRAVARGSTLRLSRIAVFRRAAPTLMFAIAGDGQAALTDDQIPGPISVRVVDAQGRPVPRVPVRFDVIAGAGRIDGPATAMTDADGTAVLLGRWLVGSAVGVNQLRASTDQGATPSALFTAVAQQRPPPVIGVSAANIAVTTRSAGPDPVAQIIAVTNTHTQALPLIGLELRDPAYASGQDWLELALDRSSAPAQLTVRPRVGTLAEGVYVATFSVASSMPDVAAVGLTVTFTVTPGLPARLAIVTAPSGGIAGDPLPTQPVIEVQDGNGRRVQATTSVTVSLASGDGSALTGTRTQAAVAGRVAFTDLVIGVSGSHTLRFAATGLTGVDAPAITVLPRPTLQTAPATVSLTALLGSPAPASASVALTSSTSTTIADLAVTSISYGPGATGWLTASLSGTATPASLTISPTANTLGEGSYTATINVGSAYGAQSIAVTLTVTLPPLPPAPTNPSFIDDFNFGIDAGTWDVANYPFGRGWFRSTNAITANGNLILTSPSGTRDGAELITRRRFPRARFEADLACNAPRGAICALFLYETGVGDFADEVDIEINAATNQVLLTTWVAGVRSNTITRTYPVGLDPRQTHRYTILQEPGAVSFYIGDIPLARFTTGVPQRDMELAVSLWWPTWLGGPPAYGDMTVGRIRAWF
jgi:hypothetical protein